MRFVKVQDEERSGQVAINLDLVREAHFGGDYSTCILSGVPPHRMT